MRRTLLAACLALTGCAGTVPPEGFYSCDVVPAGDYDSRFAPSGLRQEHVNRAVKAALDGATFATDIRLHDQTENCRKLQGYRVYTKATFAYDLTGQMANGHSVCLLKYIVVGTPEPLDWRASALVHELFHAMQECVGTPPADPGFEQYPGHENWVRDGILRAIDYEATQP